MYRYGANVVSTRCMMLSLLSSRRSNRSRKVTFVRGIGWPQWIKSGAKAHTRNNPMTYDGWIKPIQMTWVWLKKIYSTHQKSDWWCNHLRTHGTRCCIHQSSFGLNESLFFQLKSLMGFLLTSNMLQKLHDKNLRHIKKIKISSSICFC